MLARRVAMRIVASRQLGSRAMRSASGATTRSSIVRRSGRAPSFGSWPSSASRARAAGVSSRRRLRATRPGPLAQLGELELDDPLERGAAERAERDGSRRGGRAARAGRSCLIAPRVIGGGIGIRREPGGRRIGGAEVRRHHDHRHAEVDEAAERVGEPAFADHAEQEIERGGVGLLDLVEQRRPRAAGGGSRSARLVPAGDGVISRAIARAGDELAHVDADEPIGVAEQVARELLGELGLADAGRAREQERADRALRIVEAGLEPRDHARRDRARLVLADDALLRAARAIAAVSSARSGASRSTGRPDHAPNAAVSSLERQRRCGAGRGREVVDERERLARERGVAAERGEQLDEPARGVVRRARPAACVRWPYGSSSAIVCAGVASGIADRRAARRPAREASGARARARPRRTRRTARAGRRSRRARGARRSRRRRAIGARTSASRST